MACCAARAERRQLAAHWCSHALEDVLGELQGALRQYNTAVQQCREVDQAVDRAVLSEASVIGMTTSGVAAKQTLINAVGPKVGACMVHADGAARLAPSKGAWW